MVSSASKERQRKGRLKSKSKRRSKANRVTFRKVTFHLTDGELESLELLRTETGLPVAEHIRRAVDAYLERYNEPEDNQEGEQE